MGTAEILLPPVRGGLRRGQGAIALAEGKGSGRPVAQEGVMDTIFEDRRAGRDRRKGERRRVPEDADRVPEDQDRRTGMDRRRTARRVSDREDAVPERYDYQWRNRWP
jgi:hypothetical protein